MADLFADTSGWANLFDVTQPFHELASQIYREARASKRKVVTTSLVLTELVALLSSPLRIPRPQVVALIQGLRASPYVVVEFIDADIDARAWKMLETHVDKQWSLVDCASFHVMRTRGLTEALTSDHHFEQAGFTRLLK